MSINELLAYRKRAEMNAERGPGIVVAMTVSCIDEMNSEHEQAPGRPISAATTASGHPVFLDPAGTLADGAIELRGHLALLAEERLAARDAGLDDPDYLEDLELEVAETRFAHAGAVVLRLAVFRGDVDGRPQG